MDGSPSNTLIKQGRAARAAELASRWFRRATTFPTTSFETSPRSNSVFQETERWLELLKSSKPALREDVTALAEALERSRPRPDGSCLIHGTLYARHLLDLGDGIGVIDWDRFGRGPAEFDAGVFLATAWRSEVNHGTTREVDAKFHELSRGMLDMAAVTWYRAVTLLRLAAKMSRRNGILQERARVFLNEAERAVAAYDVGSSG